ncbi:uncharacterized protein EV420DRAFT_1600290 [Desarmillaria tabescens]|uniref:DEAD/DEAH-box helicase domain-containing protein n=1 Tax=Armillaria tabescens TaxID=1929756 RepID=A0AA39J310_ARMTA|nr:uncharacterized protein EV420DRAFT_1600290 [Desarmillaria tabescens]KAK0433483.1 hypothetical protein EV420DRAFT_1600290 [Desarmillaria tabescens]
MYILATVAPRCRLMQPCLSLMIFFLLCCLNQFFPLQSPSALTSVSTNSPLPRSQLYCTFLPLRLPEESFFETLSPVEQALAWRSCLLVYIASHGTIFPRDDQIRAALWSAQGRDSVVIAPTGWGKTLCVLMPLLLFPTTTSITVSPLKRLQIMQVCHLYSFFQFT